MSDQVNYKDQYKHPKWQKKRLEILERDGFKCTKCGDKETTLHVHHIYYKKDNKVWEYPDDCLITLCADCHNDWHEAERENKDIVYGKLMKHLGNGVIGELICLIEAPPFADLMKKSIENSMCLLMDVTFGTTKNI